MRTKMQAFKLGDIFDVYVEFEDDPANGERRPVIVIGEQNNDIFILVSTTSEPRNHPLRWYDKFKIPIHNWRKSGFDRASWCNGKILIKYSTQDLKRLITPEDYRGRITRSDFNYIIEKLNELYEK